MLIAFKQIKPSDAIKKGKRGGGKINKDLFIFFFRCLSFFSYLEYITLFFPIEKIKLEFTT